MGSGPGAREVAAPFFRRRDARANRSRRKGGGAALGVLGEGGRERGGGRGEGANNSTGREGSTHRGIREKAVGRGVKRGITLKKGKEWCVVNAACQQHGKRAGEKR